MNDGGPAFPTPIAGCNDGCVYPASQVVQGGEGMSLRDWFAGMALQGMLANGFQPNCVRENYQNTADFNYVRAAYRLADQMLDIRNAQK